MKHLAHCYLDDLNWILVISTENHLAFSLFLNLNLIKSEIYLTETIPQIRQDGLVSSLFVVICATNPPKIWSAYHIISGFTEIVEALSFDFCCGNGSEFCESACTLCRKAGKN
jgi:hypothetical protein